MNHYPDDLEKNKQANYLLLAFFVVSVIEVIAEYNEDKLLIWLTKPVILPLLMFYYLKRSKKVSLPFILALMSSWIANMFFIQNTFQFIIYGVSFFMIYRILVIYIIVNKVKMPNSIPLIIGSLPFVFIYVVATFFTYEILGYNVYLFLIQGIFTIFLGGFSLGSFIMINNKPNAVLLISTMCMAFNQFVFVLKFYSHEANTLQAFAMILFVLGQYLLTKYMFYTEKNKYSYQIIDGLTENN
ncbi:MAG TPA: lysoplasmalogenase family protein [Flavobacterium sp.]|uniref:lysoplasmalogenase family protein n=1 Tax=Flavobacterium sp. TaxID=239 RepID=UPI002C3AFCB2|nr:lysoplasmalogenase family protein [Flavobacterium sp.]HNP32626.1 lysoplasmalogenase family protein [Flavobacterium sp.]